MNYPIIYDSAEKKISFDDFLAHLAKISARGAKIITTNGCFDLLHPGHISLLKQARALGDLLIVGLNSDASVAANKGPGRPLRDEYVRAMMLLSLRHVDYVLIFDDLLPTDWLAQVQPYRHCKAGDYDADMMPETDVVRAGGGDITIFPLIPKYSTTVLAETFAGQITQPTSRQEWAIKYILDDSNLLRRIAYQCAGQIIDAATVINQLLLQGQQLLFNPSPEQFIPVEYYVDQLINNLSFLPDAPIIDVFMNNAEVGDVLVLTISKDDLRQSRALIKWANNLELRVIIITDEYIAGTLSGYEVAITLPILSPAEFQFVHQTVMQLLVHLLTMDAIIAAEQI